MRLLLHLIFLLPFSAAFAQTEPTALDLLQRVYSATLKLSYTGTFLYQQGQSSETSRITRIVDSSGAHERLETLDGMPREIIRRNDEVVCYLPATMTVRVDKLPGRSGLPASIPVHARELGEYYTVRKGEIERVAGYDCQIVFLEPKDNLRYGHKLWVDLSTGMLLKAHTIGRTGEDLERFAFSDLQIGGNIDRDKLRSRYSRKGKDWRIEDSAGVHANLVDAGWSIKAAPIGFKKVSEMTRTLGGASGVGHIVLSDGLAAVSVFIESAASRQAGSQPGLVRQGAIHVYMRLIGNHWITVVGEAPAENVRFIANAVEYRKPR
ncbi:MAG: siderophore-interacting protein [Betaproteobacteria bacterium]|nr:siderophore-interacting protein [Betaproteobacteria bacterium]